MFELINLKGNTYCITMPTNIGVYKVSDDEVILIDTGINQRAGARILSILEKQGWRVKAVILTHSHTDHAGGARYLADTLGCKIYASEVERIFVENPDLEPAVVYGAFPCRDFRIKFMNTTECKTSDIRELDVPEGMEFFSLPGHFADMIGVKTPDDVYFVADSVNTEKTLEHTKLCFVFNVEEQYKTLQWIKCLDSKLCVPSHGEPTTEIAHLADVNIANLDEIAEYILNVIDNNPMSVEQLVQRMNEDFSLGDNFVQYVMSSAAVRTFLTYLRHQGKITYSFKDRIMLWEKA
ncbi:MAG: MBL fold metallo-hydrolase [Ruminococcus sp.]